MARFAITYEEFLARATEQHGEEWARANAPEYGRRFALDCRKKAEAASTEDAAALRRVADQMDPEVRPDDQEVPNAAAGQ